MSNPVFDQVGKEMEKSVQSFQRELVKVRTGRATPALVEGIQVEYYGAKTPLSQVANVTTPDARTIQIVPWEQSVAGAIEKAIHAANIGLTPQSDGKMVRISVPALTEDRRKELVKLVKKLGEDSKVAIRNQRRDANELMKKAEKDKAISSDELKKSMDQIQKKTDEKIAEIDKITSIKEKEILTL